MGDSESDSDDSCDSSEEHNGRHIRVDTGYYEVQVHGDPDDNLSDLLDVFNEAADRALEDVEQLDDRIDENSEDRYVS